MVVDEVHGIGTGYRWLGLELLPATIDRDCKHLRFLLITQFVTNCVDNAQWIAPDGHRSVSVGVDLDSDQNFVALSRLKRAGYLVILH